MFAFIMIEIHYLIYREASIFFDKRESDSLQPNLEHVQSQPNPNPSRGVGYQAYYVITADS